MSPSRLFTEDTLFDGRLKCLQHRYGYRFSLDAVLLANFVSPKKSDRILDLGGGCGIVSLILAYRHSELQLTSLELQAELAVLAKRNIEINNGTDWISSRRIHVIKGDLCSIENFIQAGSNDWIVSNPPYRKTGTGKVNPASEQAIARHEIGAGLPEIMRAAAFAVRTRGKVTMIYPSTRAASLVTEMKNRGLEPKRQQIVYSYPGSDAKFVLVEAIKGGGEVKILPPFFVYKKAGGDYSEEMARCYKP